MKEKKSLLKELLKFSKILGDRGWTPGSSGNVSAIIPGTRQIYIKRTGRSLFNITPKDILTVDLDGNVMEGEGKPTKEVRFHLGIYHVRNDVKAIIHAHPPFATAFAIAGKALFPQTAPGRTILKRVPMVKFSPPGSEELAEDVVQLFQDHEIKAVILEGHGIVTVGQNLNDAYNITEWVEDAAKEAFLVSLLKKFTS